MLFWFAAVLATFTISRGEDIHFQKFFAALPFNDRIVNGTDAFPGEIPYIVSLRFNRSHTCGASILNPSWVLSAAHCVYGRDPTLFSVQFGTVEISKDDALSIPVESIIWHENYVGSSAHLNDVSILKLPTSMSLGRAVQPIILPPAFNSTPERADAVVSGWGLPFSNGSVMQILQKVDIKVYTDDLCEEIHAKTGPTDRFYHICAGVPEGGKGQCNGDSGGPLVVNGVQVGIVSWSVKPCTVVGYPGVYTKVSSYVNWIYENIRSYETTIT